MIRCISLVAALAFCLSTPAAAQEACKMMQVANPGKGGRVPDLKPDFFRDGAALYAIARQQGEALLAQGYGVMIGTAAAPRANHATWNINYHKEGAKDLRLLVIVDANTGKLEKAIK